MVTSLVFEVPPLRVDNSVWTWLSREKLNRMKLSTSAAVDVCHVSMEPFARKSRLVVSHGEGGGDFGFRTEIHNTNTAQEFRELDRKRMFSGLLDRRGRELEQQNVFVISFADLKSYTFTFNVALPSVSPREYDFECAEVISSDSEDAGGPNGVYISIHSSGEVPFIASKVAEGSCLIFRDSRLSCSAEALPFYARNYLTSIALSTEREISITVKIFGSNRQTEFRAVRIRPTRETRVVSSWVKWPSSSSSLVGETAIQSVDLKRFLDPAYIAAESVELNVKLIKWRLIPALEPERMSSLSFLLIGAGTLGCAVARCLVSWGVKKITLVDSGRVSFSNPARQWLFRLEDAVNNAPKAETAANRLREIQPSLDVTGLDLSVPLPGHPADLEGIDEKISKLQSLVHSHHVVFTLTDSRESRWLPSLLVAAASRTTDKKKAPPLGVSVALGFDSYLVKLQSLGEKKSSCYFCNDVSAPCDQTKFRTLDQMCTVTRPGLAAIASCVAVELVASLSQTEQGLRGKRSVEDHSLLGATPDQVRGFLSNFQSFPAVTEPFEHCICCSEKILGEFEKNGFEFVKQIILDGAHLMSLSGLDAFNARTDLADVISFNDHEEIIDIIL